MADDVPDLMAALKRSLGLGGGLDACEHGVVPCDLCPEASLHRRIAELVAENKRLRDALGAVAPAALALILDEEVSDE